MSIVIEIRNRTQNTIVVRDYVVAYKESKRIPANTDAFIKSLNGSLVITEPESNAKLYADEAATERKSDLYYALLGDFESEINKLKIQNLESEIVIRRLMGYIGSKHV